MGYVIREIEIEGRRAVALFDTGAFDNFIVMRKVPPHAKYERLKKPTIARVPFRQEELIVDTVYYLRVKIGEYEREYIEFLPVNHDYIDVVYDRDDRPRGIEAIIGVKGMERMRLIIDPKEDKIYLCRHSPPKPGFLEPIG